MSLLELQGQQRGRISSETLSSHTLLWTTVTTSSIPTALLSLCGSNLGLGVCSLNSTEQQMLIIYVGEGIVYIQMM